MELNKLFDIARIKCELTFLDFSGKFEEFEELKEYLRSECIIIRVEDKDYFFEYNEKGEKEDSNILLNSNQTPKFFLYAAIADEKNAPTFISTYTNCVSERGKEFSLLFLICNKKEDIRNLVRNSNIVVIEKKKKFSMEIRERIKGLIGKFVKKVKGKENNMMQSQLDSKSLLNVKYKCEEYIQAGIYDIPLQHFKVLNEEIKIPSEQAKVKECQVLTKFLLDYQNQKGEIVFNAEIERLYELVFLGYKKAKQQELLISAIIRLIIYFSYFEDKKQQMWKNIQKIYLEVLYMNPIIKYRTYIRIYFILLKAGLIKKAIFFLYLAIFTCYENSNLIHFIPELFKELNLHMEIYDVSHFKINTYDTFIKIHNIIIKNSLKPIEFYSKKREQKMDEIIECKQKRIEKEYDLYIKHKIKLISKILLEPKWLPLQYNIFANLIYYYKTVSNQKLKITNILTSLQTLHNYIPQKEQQELIDEHNKDSLYLQEKIKLNLIKLPILISIIPIPSDVKFDVIKNTNIKKNKEDNDVFIFNPWDKSNDINYYWTKNSSQRILIKFYNPFSFEINLTKIEVIFTDKKSFAYPSNTIIPPRKISEIIYRVNLLEIGKTNIIGIKYEIENSAGVQYVDQNGNGLFYSFDQRVEDPLSLMKGKKRKVNLKGIQIFPEIAHLSIRIENDDFNKREYIDLFDYERVNFYFTIQNPSKVKINEVNVLIYAYKKEDYKISLEEQTILLHEMKEQKEMKYRYEYIHKRQYKRIEFKFYYKVNNSIEMNIKPFLYFSKRIKTKRLFEFWGLKVSSMLTNNSLLTILKEDKRITNDFQFFYCTSQFYINFNFVLLQRLNIIYSICNSNWEIKETKENLIRPDEKKEISLICDNKEKLSSTSIEWKTESECNEGSIDLFQILSNEFNYTFNQLFNLDIKSQSIDKEDNCNEIIYIIENRTKGLFEKIQISIFLFQVFNGVYYVNDKMNNGLFYEGSLEHTIPVIKPLEKLSYAIRIYGKENETLNTTFALCDRRSHIVYIPSFVKQIII